jgi:hypothetical protein
VASATLYVTPSFGPKRDEVRTEYRRLYNEKLYDLYSSTNIIWVIKLRRMRWVRHVASTVERRGAYTVLEGKPVEMRQLGRPRLRCEDNIKVDLQEVGWGNGLD